MKIHMKNIFYCIFLLSLITGCIDKIELKEANVPRKLIVDGTVTNYPGPYFVTLSYSEPFNSTKITELISGATVTISDNLGNIYPLSAFTNGVYKTDSASFRGVVGRSYSVNIKTLDGKQYKSRPESILPPVPIDSISSRFVPGQIRTASFEVSVKVKDPSVSGNFYRWKWRNYDTIDICRITRTKNDGGSFVFLAPCCQKCWQITTCYGCLALFSDDLTNGKTFTQKVANIPFDNSYDYYMQIDQYSISKENYNYWNLVQGQISNSGGIFDNTPAFIEGNVYNVNDPNDQVLGIFNVMGATKKITYIQRSVKGQSPYVPPPISGTVIYERNCFECKGDIRTPIKPEGWRG